MSDQPTVIELIRELLSKWEQNSTPLAEMGLSLVEKKAEKFGVTRKTVWNFLMLFGEICRTADGPFDAAKTLLDMLEELDILHWEKIQSIFDLSLPKETAP